LNEYETTLRAISLILTIFFGKSEFWPIFMILAAHSEFIVPAALKLNFAAAGSLQLIAQIFADSFTASDLLGIDTEGIWKIRIFTFGIPFVANFVLMINHITPVFYFRLSQEAMPANAWILSLMSTSLVFISFNLLVIVQICKTANNWKILRQVGKLKKNWC